MYGDDAVVPPPDADVSVKVVYLNPVVNPPPLIPGYSFTLPPQDFRPPSPVRPVPICRCQCCRPKMCSCRKVRAPIGPAPVIIATPVLAPRRRLSRRRRSAAACPLPANRILSGKSGAADEIRTYNSNLARFRLSCARTLCTRAAMLGASPILRRSLRRRWVGNGGRRGAAGSGAFPVFLALKLRKRALNGECRAYRAFAVGALANKVMKGRFGRSDPFGRPLRNGRSWPRSRSPLPRGYRQFMGPISKARSGSSRRISTPSGNGRYLRIPAGRSRRQAVVASRFP